jgi:hypothetical protein
MSDLIGVNVKFDQRGHTLYGQIVGQAGRHAVVVACQVPGHDKLFQCTAHLSDLEQFTPDGDAFEAAKKEAAKAAGKGKRAPAPKPPQG